MDCLSSTDLNLRMEIRDLVDEGVMAWEWY